jgi:hypothetical protein
MSDVVTFRRPTHTKDRAPKATAKLPTTEATPTAKARLKAPGSTRPKDFVHPTHQPSADSMLDELARATIEEGFGALGYISPWAVAAKLEAELYNAWVRLQCLTLNLSNPGSLSSDQYVERFWNPTNCQCRKCKGY